MNKTKILLIRLDKIGDLVCTLPVDEVFTSDRFDVHWVIQKGMGSIVRSGIRERAFTELDKNDSKGSQIILQDLLQKFKPDAAISFQGPWWANYQIWKALVPLRFGVKSQWHSFLFLNHGLRQRRSLAEQHEFQYNLDLVQMCWNELQKKISHGAKAISKQFISDQKVLILSDFQKDIWSKKYFQIQKPKDDSIFQSIVRKISDTNKMVSPSSAPLLKTKNYIVVHAGMAGSALNWPETKYIEQIEWILQNKSEDFKVVLTGTPADEPYLTKIKSQFKSHPRVVNLQSQLSFEELLHILYFASHVVAPSTGVAHLAASLDQKVFALFSPIRVHHPRRWAPRGPHVTIALPPQMQDPVDASNVDESCMQTIEINRSL